MALALQPSVTDPRELALLKAVGLDRVSPEQRELALHIATRYDLDLMLKHLVMIEGRPYITRDALLHIAHRSGVLDGIETTEPTLVDGFWRATCSVYRKDMTRPFTYGGRYPEAGSNRKFAPEMAIKVAESMALRRAFDVAAPTQDERWDVPDAPVVEPPKPTTLAEKAAERAQVVTVRATDAHEHEYVNPDSGDGTPVFNDPVCKHCGLHAPLPVAEGQEDFELLDPVPDTTTLTVEQFETMAKQYSLSPQSLTAVRRQMYPDVTRWADVTDEQRANLIAEILR